MRFSKSYFARLSYLALLGLVLLVIQSCLFSGGSRRGGGGAHVYRGYYSITYPTAGTYLNLDSTYQILWTKGDTVKAAFVNIFLYHVDTLKSVVANSAQNNGTFSWTMRNTKVGSGTGYHLKIVSTTDTSQWDVSYDFVIHSNYSGAISVTGPAAGTLAQVDSALAVRWTSLGTIGTYVSIQLLKDTTLAATVSTLAANSGSYNWSRVSTVLGTGSTYRIKISSVSDPAIQGYSPAFTINSGYSGTIAITSPKTGDSLTGGTASIIAWTITGNPGTTANIQLFRDSILVSPLGTGTNLAAGSLGWLPSAGMVSSDKYRIKIASVQDPGMVFYSGNFSIGGVSTDAYEIDDSLRLAKPILSDGSSQSHTITYLNADWMQFSAISGQGYLATVKASGTFSVSLYLYDSLGGLLTSKAGNLAQILTTPAVPGNYFLRVTSLSGFGPYTIALNRFDTSQTGGFPAKFSSPDSSTIWAGGSTYLMSWTPDSLLYGPYVNLQLYRDTTLVQTIASSASNGGSYSWSTSAGMMTSNKYRIRMTNTSNPQIYGYSASFTLSGLNPDSYEPDNTRGTAKDIPTNGTAQARTLTATDPDWIKFPVQAGQSYWIKAATAATTSLAVYADSLSTATLGSSSTTNPSVLIAATTTGTYYIQVSGFNYGSYSISTRLYQPDSMVKFSNPTGNSTFSAGSSYSLSWQPDSSLATSSVYLYLYRANTQIASIAYTSFNAGTVSWAVPVGLASGSDYQVRIPFNTGLTANSPRFSISGMPSDSLEANDSVAAARTIVPNVGRRQLSLTYADKDWFQFAAKAKMVYVLQTIAPTSMNHNISLYNGLGASLIKQGTRATSDTVNTLAWFCPIDATHSFSVIPTNTTNSGVYALEFKAYAPADYQFLVSAPLAGTALKNNVATTIQWSNNADIKGTVDLFLFNTAGVVKTIAAGVANTGSYAWTVDATLAAGSDYYVKVSSLIGSDIAGNSGVFSVGP